MLRRDFLKFLGLAALAPTIGYDPIIPDLLPAPALPPLSNQYIYLKAKCAIPAYSMCIVNNGKASLLTTKDIQDFRIYNNMAVAEHNFKAGDYGWFCTGGTPKVLAVAA